MNRITRAAEALGVPKLKNVREKLAKIAAVFITISGLFLNIQPASANTLAQAKVALSDPRPSGTSNYTFTGGQTGGLVTSAAIQCVMVTVSTTTGGTVAPTNFTGNGATINAASSTLINSSATGWSLAQSDGAGSSAGAKNVFKYTHATTGVTPSTTSGATFEIDGVTNSSVADTKYFFTLQTFTNTDCATGPTDNAAPLFINTAGSTLSLTVDQTLTFTVNAVGTGTGCDGTTTTGTSTATTIPFGTVTSASNGVVCQDLTASTNATNGYTVFARYTAAPTNALGQTIADWTGTNGAPTTFPAAGTEAYGITTNDASLSVTGNGANRFTSPSQNWSKLTTSNAEVAFESAGVTSTTYRIGHQVGVSLTTKPGTYTTTVIYTCTPVF